MWAERGCPLSSSCEHRSDLVAHARRHAIVHQLLLFCACEASHELNEIVNTQRSARSRCALTESLFSLGDVRRRGDGDEVDPKHEPSPDQPESFDSAGLSARRWLPSPGLGRLSMLAPKGRQERERGLDELRVRVLRLRRCGVLLAIDGVRIFARRGRYTEHRAVDR